MYMHKLQRNNIFSVNYQEILYLFKYEANLYDDSKDSKKIEQ